MNDAPRLKLVEVERYERDVRLRLPFRFGVTTVTHATQAVIRATIALPDGRTRAGRRGRDAGGEMVRQEPRAVGRTEPRPAAAVARDRDRALHGARLRHAVRPVRRRLSRAAGARRGARPQSARRLLRTGAPRPRHRRCARARDRPLLPGDGLAEPPRHPRDRPHARPRRLRHRRLPRRLAHGAVDRGPPHRRPRRSDHRRRPEARRARRRRSSRDARGGRAPLPRPLLQAEGRRQCRGRPRAPRPASPRCSTARCRSIARRSTATSNTRASKASPSCGGACAKRRR